MISVKDLIEDRNTSDPSLVNVCGRLHTVVTSTTSTTDDYSQRGTLLLVDILTGQDAILCQVDRTYHDLQNTLISIPHWNFVDLGNGQRYLQFTMDSVSRLGSPVGTILMEKSLAVQATLQLLNSSSSTFDFSFVSPEQLATVYAGGDDRQRQTVVGRLSAKSTLYNKPGSEACFFIELEDVAKPDSTTLTYSAPAFQWTVPVMFKGDCFIKYYGELLVGRYYVFTHLQTATLTTSSTTRHEKRKQTKRSVLKFHSTRSSFLELTEHQCQQLLLEYNHSDFKTVSFDLDTSRSTSSITTAPIVPLATLDAKKVQLETYTGVVTRVINPLFGIYELDQRILLCLFHYLGYSENCPFSVGTRLTISHAHVLTLDSLSDVSPLLDLDWKAPRIIQLKDDDDSAGQRQHQISSRYILVACMRSDVRIDRFMDTNNNTNNNNCDMMDSDNNAKNQRHFNHLVYTHCMSRHLNFTALVRQLELFASINMKFKDFGGAENGDTNMAPSLIWIGKKLVEMVFSTTGNRSTHGQGDLYGDFFQHDFSCLAVNESTNLARKVILDSCPTLDQLISIMLGNNKVDAEPLSYKLQHAPLIEIPPSFITSHSDVTRYCYDATTKNTDWVIGLVDSLPDGRMYFMDDTCRILLLVDNNTGSRHTSVGATNSSAKKVSLGHMYMIKRFHLVVEKLTFSRNGRPLEQRYMMCDSHDMIYLAPFTPSAACVTTLSAYIPTRREDLMRLSYFVLVDDATMDLDLTIYNIMEMIPTTMVKDENGTVGFEKWIRVIRYNVKSRSNLQHSTITEDDTPLLATLVFTSKMNSLSYLGDLKQGSWFGLTSMDRSDQFDTSYAEADLNEDATFFVDRNKHQIYSITPRFGPLDQNNYSHHDHQGNIVHIDAVLIRPPRRPSPANLQRWKLIPPVLSVANAIQEHKKQPSPSRQQQQKRQDGKGGDKRITEIFNIHGTVLFKGFTNDTLESFGTESGDSNENNDMMLFERLGIGLGRRGPKVFLRLQQVDGLETTDIYIGGDMHHLMYPLGVIPGNRITIFRVERRKAASSQKVYFTACPYTYIQPYPQLSATLFDDLLYSKNNIKVPALDLSSLLPSEQNDHDEKGGIGNTVFKVTITIRSILKLELQWICTTCGKEWYREKCYGNCDKDSGRVFRAEAKVQVSDGTADVVAMIDGEALVFRLLMLLPSQEQALKQAVLQHGRLAAGKWLGKEDGGNNGPKPDMTGASLRNGMTLDDLCKRARKYGRFDLYGKRYYQQFAESTFAESQMDQLGLRSLSLKGQRRPMETLAYLFVKVKVEALEFVEPQQQAWKLIKQLS
ncbi:CST, telomere maintenance, complex subunit CTC1-domain-containing protein [Chlamydoabsidia padenii]|nr:CST, telomere maintenance, complex subunit CTC1-domain-containing protein [Chlamydoabsidia padenii]